MLLEALVKKSHLFSEPGVMIALESSIHTYAQALADDLRSVLQTKRKPAKINFKWRRGGLEYHPEIEVFFKTIMEPLFYLSPATAAHRKAVQALDLNIDSHCNRLSCFSKESDAAKMSNGRQFVLDFIGPFLKDQSILTEKKYINFIEYKIYELLVMLDPTLRDRQLELLDSLNTISSFHL